MTEPVYEVVWPLGKLVYKVMPLARRNANLTGKTVCELSDFRFRAEEIMPLLRELLSKRYSGIKFVDATVFGETHGPRERDLIANLPALLKQHKCDAVISGVGA